MDYKIDYGAFALNQPPPKPADLPLYASVDGRVASLANGEVVFFDPSTDRSHVMTAQVLQAMNLCRDFQPLERHVKAVSEKIPGLQGQDAAVRRVLEGLATRGLLISDDAFLIRLSKAPGAELAPPTAVFIRACERPAQLRRLLDSLLAHVQRFGVRYRVVLIDDSRAAEAQRAHADLLRHFGEVSGCTCVRIAEAGWRKIAAPLAASLPEHADALQALLQRDPRERGRNGGGLGRNLITLLAAGERYLLLDDDFEFPLRRHPEYRPGLAFDARGWAVRSYGSQQAALAAGDELDGDPLALQLALCGQSLGAALGRVDGFSLGRAGMQGLAPSVLPMLRGNTRIAMTINGHRGAAGASGLTWLYMLDAAGRAGLLGDGARYTELRGDPPVWFGASRYVLGNGSNFTPFAIDNRRLLPPTSPYGRGEDGLFNALVQLSDGEAQAVDVPYAIGHVQEGRRDRDALLASPETPTSNLCFGELARHVASNLYAAEPGPRLALYAARLDDLAGGSDDTVLSYMREYLGYRRSTAVEQLQQVAATAGAAPAAWAADLRTLIETNGRAVAERGVPRFAGWDEQMTASDCAKAFREEARVLADGMRAWPAAWQVALEQREQWLQPTVA